MIKVVYQSKRGNTEKVAKAIGKGAGAAVEPFDKADLSTPVDLLFLGGAIYAGQLDSAFAAFIASLTAEKVKAIAVFSTAAGNGRALPQIESLLSGKGIRLLPEECAIKGKFLFVNKNRPNEADLQEAEAFGRRIAQEQQA